MQEQRGWGWVAILLLVVTACGGSSGPVAGPCVPGATQVCACPGGRTGVQTCNGAGSGFGDCQGCGGPTDSGRICTPGATFTCACPGGQSGVQTCDSSGMSFGDCRGCPTTADSGQPRCLGRVCGSDGAGGSCGTCPSGQSCTVDGRCEAATVNCGAQTTCGGCTPLAGCGWCGATGACVRVNPTCTGPATGICPGQWACSPPDCTTPTTCLACTSDSQCPGGFCGRRYCDGMRGCYPSSGTGACSTIGGAACPAVSVYRRCTTSSQCGPGSACVPVYPGDNTTVCQPSCTTHDDCPPVPPGYPGVLAFCASGTGRCVLSCDRTGGCTEDGLTCRRSGSGNYAYCL